MRRPSLTRQIFPFILFIWMTSFGAFTLIAAFLAHRAHCIALEGGFSESIPSKSPLTNVYLAILLCSLGLTLVSIPMIYFQLRRRSSVFEDLRQLVREIGKGSLNGRIRLPMQEDTAGLAGSINRMADRLNRRIQAMLQGQNHQEAILSSMREGVVAIDLNERILQINKAALILVNGSESDAKDKFFAELVRSAELQRIARKVLANGEELAVDVVLDNSDEILIEAQASPLLDQHGARIGALLVLNDVTRLRRLETVRQDFVANVSHELRTPITSIKGYAETLLDGALENPIDARRFLEIIAKQSERLHSIFEDLLTLSRIEHGEREHNVTLEISELRQVIESAVADVSDKANGAGIKIEASCPEGIELKLNQGLLQHALTNLLDNAIKYSNSGHSVNITVDSDSSEVAINVIDQGCGIPEQHLKRLFERFYRVDRARSRKVGGTGLGLSIVKHIAEVHAGSVTVTSSPGSGSTFSIHLPKA